jgi:hypothetical protein
MESLQGRIGSSRSTSSRRARTSPASPQAARSAPTQMPRRTGARALCGATRSFALRVLSPRVAPSPTKAPTHPHPHPTHTTPRTTMPPPSPPGRRTRRSPPSRRAACRGRAPARPRARAQRPLFPHLHKRLAGSCHRWPEGRESEGAFRV